MKRRFYVRLDFTRVFPQVLVWVATRVTITDFVLELIFMQALLCRFLSGFLQGFQKAVQVGIFRFSAFLT